MLSAVRLHYFSRYLLVLLLPYFGCDRKLISSISCFGSVLGYMACATHGIKNCGIQLCYNILNFVSRFYNRIPRRSVRSTSNAKIGSRGEMHRSIWSTNDVYGRARAASRWSRLTGGIPTLTNRDCSGLKRACRVNEEVA